MALDRYEATSIETKWQRRWEESGLFVTPNLSERPKLYVLEMFPYPSGAGLSVGHIKNYAPTDAYCRYKRMRGFNVLHPMGWDAFGQPAENEAIKRGRNPREMVPEYAANYKRTLKRIGACYDWSREINSSLPEYYRWTQWFFLLLYKRGLAYRASAPINWCPHCSTGLANEEVKEGRCWRCDTPVQKRQMPQWYFRITAYADRLLADLDGLDWPAGTIQMQREWIGRSEGAEVDFPLADGSDKLRVYTTRPDTLWGATFMVIAPEHPMVSRLVVAERREEVERYIRRAQRITEKDRLSAERTKTGVFTGSFAINPVNGERIPIWVADYVLMGYGTGAIMAVPAHDQRDFEFARKYGLHIEQVYTSEDGPQTGDEMTRALPDGGRMRAFEPGPGALCGRPPFAGMPNNRETVSQVVRWLEEQGVGDGRVNYRLRDWLISRQRYWGAPIPIIHCASCGEVAVAEEDLPVVLPEVERYQPSGTGESPLATIPEFVNTACPQCGAAARRETDTMGGFACSSWYFLRFLDPHNETAFAARELVDYWMPVDLYTGGAEHSVMHLLYARFWVKVMQDAGLVRFSEPFKRLRHQGSMLAYTPGRRPRAGEAGEGLEDGESTENWIVLKPEELAGFPEDQIVWRWARMSKSRGNVVTPDDVCEQYGADSLRVYEMFVAPFEEDVRWSQEGITGAQRFILRVWRWVLAAAEDLAVGGGGLREPDEAAVRVRRKLHQTLRKVGGHIEELSFNTALAAIMELMNELYLWRPVDTAPGSVHAATLREAAEHLVLMLAPFTPHLSDELWERLGHTGYTLDVPWPEVDEAAAAESLITLAVQVDGKVRDRLTVPADATEDEVKSLALASPKVASVLQGRAATRVVVVPGRLVNVVP